MHMTASTRTHVHTRACALSEDPQQFLNAFIHTVKIGGTNFAIAGSQLFPTAQCASGMYAPNETANRILIRLIILCFLCFLCFRVFRDHFYIIFSVRFAICSYFFLFILSLVGVVLFVRSTIEKGQSLRAR